MKILSTYGVVLFENEDTSLARTLEMAANNGTDLSEANLSGANLVRADLSWANLSEANLSGADLSEANLFRADLFGANLSGANLSEASLSGANLVRANLSWADLSGANLFRADLSEANLSGINFSSYESLLACRWSTVSDELCIQLMDYDCANLDNGLHLFDRWKSDGVCPFQASLIGRSVNFAEKKNLWVAGRTRLQPLTARELVQRLIREKCVDSDFHKKGASQDGL